MINIYIVLACYFMAALFYTLEYKFGSLCLEYANKAISVTNTKWLSQSQNSALWLARFFIITALILSVIEQVQFILSE